MEKDSPAFDYSLAGANLKRRHDERQARRRKLFEQAQADSQNIVAMIIARYAPRRVYQWGSLLQPEHFDENSDIDIAVEGIESVDAFFRLYGDAMQLTRFHLDLVEFDKLTPLDRETIAGKGVVLYERAD